MTRSQAHLIRPHLLCIALTLLAISATASLPADEGLSVRPAFVSGEVLARFHAAARPTTALRAAGAEIIEVLSGAGLCRLRTRLEVDAAVRSLLASGAAEHVQPNYLYSALDAPDDPAFRAGDLWAFRNVGEYGGIPDADVDAAEAWDLTTGSSSVVVAVLDTGVDYDHEDLRANIWSNAGEVPANGRDDDGNGYTDDLHGWDAYADDGDPRDENDHGTHVAGTIGAVGNNGAGVVGVAWTVRILPLRFLGSNGSGTTADAVACLDYLNRLRDRGAPVIAVNASWGAPAAGPLPDGGVFDRALRDAIERCNSRGILFVAAAGNGDSRGRAMDNDQTPFFPASYPGANIIAVTATDRHDRKAGFANYGRSTVDVSAPGVEIWSAVRSGRYAAWSGTSMAAPMVTGAIALLRGYDWSLTHTQIRDRVLATGDPLPELETITVSGRRLNVYRMLTNGAPPPPQTDPELSVSVAAGAASYQPGRAVRLTVRAAEGSEPVGDAYIQLLIRTPKGIEVWRFGSTDAGGQVSVRYRPRKSAGRGIYAVTATGSKTGYQDANGTTSFTVE